MTAGSTTATPSTSTARSTITSPSGTASTSASAPRWRDSKDGSHSTRCCSASPSGTSTGRTPGRPAPPRSAAGNDFPSSRRSVSHISRPTVRRQEPAMQMDDMILVSIDDHMIEPPDLFENHVPDKWKDDMPKVVQNENGVDEWVFQGRATSTPFGMA